MLSGARRWSAVLHVAAAILMIGIAGPAMSTTASPPASERIADDTGGRIGTYLTKYQALRKTGQRVMIDGTCASACTSPPRSDPAQSHLRHASRGARVPRRLGSQPDWRADQHPRH